MNELERTAHRCGLVLAANRRFRYVSRRAAEARAVSRAQSLQRAEAQRRGNTRALKKARRGGTPCLES